MLFEIQEKIDTSKTSLIQKDTLNTNLNQQNPMNSTLKGNQDNITYYHINGPGVAGIAVGFLFLIGVLIGIQVMTAIFVNTKTIDEPLRMGRLEH